MRREETRLLEIAREAFSGGNLLEAMTWPRRLEREFFASGEQVAPAPSYEVDRDEIQARLARLDALDKELKGDDALIRLLRARLESHVLGARMMLALGTRELFELSKLAYGGARSTWLDDDTTNLDFAEHLAKRLGPARGKKPDEGRGHSMDARGLAAYVEERLARHKSSPKVDVVLDTELAAKAIAGKKRLRIRTDAMFELEEARSLYLHEIETHVFTAQNGAAQPLLDFLDSGGPLATRTQEGLAVFSELYAKSLTLERLRRLVERVRLVAMAEDGAGFLDLYRYLTSRGAEGKAAYTDAARVCRGGLVQGGAPFTKDACYLSGLVEVYDFLRLAVSHDALAIVEVLVSGRLSLPELEWLVELRRDGLLAAPKYMPSWIKRWDDLVAHFAFSSFLAEIDLKFVATRYRWLGVAAPVTRDEST